MNSSSNLIMPILVINVFDTELIHIFLFGEKSQKWFYHWAGDSLNHQKTA